MNRSIGEVLATITQEKTLMRVLVPTGILYASAMGLISLGRSAINGAHSALSLAIPSVVAVFFLIPGGISLVSLVWTLLGREELSANSESLVLTWSLGRAPVFRMKVFPLDQVDVIGVTEDVKMMRGRNFVRRTLLIECNGDRYPLFTHLSTAQAAEIQRRAIPRMTTLIKVMKQRKPTHG